MYYFDPHIHMVSRVTDDYETLAKMGCVGMSEPAFWAGFDRGSVDGFRDYFRQLTEFDELALNRLQHPGRQRPREVRAQHAIGRVLVGELWGGLVKGHGVQEKSKSQRRGAENAKDAEEKQNWRKVRMLNSDPLDKW